MITLPSSIKKVKSQTRFFQLAFSIITLITIIRILVLIFSPLNLYPDEAQYWSWSQQLDFGYFTKPPMIAWIIRLTTSLFGQSEWAIRLGSPLIHAGTALILFFIGKQIIDERIGFWSALAYITIPGVSYSCGLISTDVPLLFCWALALLFFLKALESADWKYPFFCGIAIGLGMLSKYAMLYFIISGVMAGLCDKKAHQFVFSLRGLTTLCVAFFIFLPNIVWNINNHFVTTNHVIYHNTNWGHANFNLWNGLDFIMGQFGVFGPVLMCGLIAALLNLRQKSKYTKQMILLSCFCLPPLIIITLKAFISGANANWAVTAYISGLPMAITMLLNWRKIYAIQISFAINIFATLMLCIILVDPNLTDRTQLFGNALKRLEGWAILGNNIVKLSSEKPYDVIICSGDTAEIFYYARSTKIPIIEWNPDHMENDYFEMTFNQPLVQKRALLVIDPPNAALAIISNFHSSQKLTTLSVPIGAHNTRETVFYDVTQ